MATRGNLSHVQALDDWEQSAIKPYLNVEKVIPGLVSRGVISKKVGRGITKSKELQVQALMGVLKKKPVGAFVAFVEALGETLSQCEDHKTLLNLMSSSIRRTDLPPQSTEVIEAIIQAAKEEKETGLVMVEKQAVHQTSSPQLRELTAHQLQLSSVASQSPIHPPSGFIESRSAYCTRNSVSLYLPESGVSVDIPSQAIPSGIGDRFWLGAFVYLRGPFQVPGGITLCTPIVWFSLYPHFKFKADVTIRIPHSAIIKRSTDLEQFCFLTIPDDPPTGPIYNLSKILPADFTDGYHAVAKVRHFSPVSFGRKQESHHDSESGLHGTRSPLRKLSQKTKDTTPFLKSLSQRSGSSFGSSQSSFEEQEQCRSTSTLGQGCGTSRPMSEVGQSLQNKDEIVSTKDRSSSLELSSSFETSESDAVNEFFIARCMPKDRCTEMWEATFMVSYCNSLGLKVKVVYQQNEKKLHYSYSTESILIIAVYAICFNCCAPFLCIYMSVQVLHRTARRKFGEDYDLSHRRFQLVDDVLTFEPSEWNDDGWSVLATETNLVKPSLVPRPSTQLFIACSTVKQGGPGTFPQ